MPHNFNSVTEPRCHLSRLYSIALTWIRYDYGALVDDSDRRERKYVEKTLFIYLRFYQKLEHALARDQTWGLRSKKKGDTPIFSWYINRIFKYYIDAFQNQMTIRYWIPILKYKVFTIKIPEPWYLSTLSFGSSSWSVHQCFYLT